MRAYAPSMPTKQDIEDAIQERLKPGMTKEAIADAVQDVLRTMIAPGMTVERVEGGGMRATMKVHTTVPLVHEAVANVIKVPGSEVVLGKGLAVRRFEEQDAAQVHRCGWCDQRFAPGDLVVRHERAGELHAGCFVHEMGMLMEETGT